MKFGIHHGIRLRFRIFLTPIRDSLSRLLFTLLCMVLYTHQLNCQTSFQPQGAIHESATSILAVDHVRVDANETSLIVSVKLANPNFSGPWFRFSAPMTPGAFYLSHESGISKLKKIEGAEPGKKIPLSWHEMVVKLTFEPLPKGTNSFDLMEGFCEGCVNIYNIAISRTQEPTFTFFETQQSSTVESIVVFHAPNASCDDKNVDSQFNIATVEAGLLENYTVINRASFDNILDEHKLAMSGLISETTAIETGQLIGAQGIVLVTEGCANNQRTYTVKLIDTQSTRTIWIASAVAPSIFHFVSELRTYLVH